MIRVGILCGIPWRNKDNDRNKPESKEVRQLGVTEWSKHSRSSGRKSEGSKRSDKRGVSKKRVSRGVEK